MPNAEVTGYRLAVKVPWDDHDARDWGGVHKRAAGVVDELMGRVGGHGRRFRIRERNDPKWGPIRNLAELDNKVRQRLRAERFHVGDVLIIVSEKDKVRWLIREVATMPKLINTSGDSHVDWMHTKVFKTLRSEFPGAQSWGICNARFIGSTTQPSMHWPRGSPATARAEDIHAATNATMRQIANHVADPAHCDKILHAGSEWLPSRGWFFVGSFIGHYDHFHWESKDSSGSLGRC